MSGAEMGELAKTVIERWGFPTLVAGCSLFCIRQDLVLPMVEAHKEFLSTIAKSQQEIAGAIHEQTRLLYALQPRSGSERTVTVKQTEPEAQPN